MRSLKFRYRFDEMYQMYRQASVEMNNNMGDAIAYTGFFGVRNWGDALNAVLLRQLSGKVPLISSLGKVSNRCLLKNPGITYSCIGSILEPASKKKNLIVHGTGFLNSTDRIIHEPQKICAVRGPLTAERVTECIGDCPKMYGIRQYCSKNFISRQPINSTVLASFHTGVIIRTSLTTMQMFPECM